MKIVINSFTVPLRPTPFWAWQVVDSVGVNIGIGGSPYESEEDAKQGVDDTLEFLGVDPETVSIEVV